MMLPISRLMCREVKWAGADGAKGVPQHGTGMRQPYFAVILGEKTGMALCRMKLVSNLSRNRSHQPTAHAGGHRFCFRGIGTGLQGSGI